MEFFSHLVFIINKKEVRTKENDEKQKVYK
jgi:hypothetical protein